MMIQSPDAIRSTLSNPATVYIIDEDSFKNRAQVVENEMVYDTIAEIPSEDFPLDGMERDETNASRDTVSALRDIIVQSEKPRFKIHLEFQSVVGRSLIAPSIIIRLKNIVQ